MRLEKMFGGVVTNPDPGPGRFRRSEVRESRSSARSVVKSGQWSCSRSNLRQRHTAMEGGHNQQRLVADAIIVGDKAEAAKMRRRAQHGAAAAGRRGESIKVARARNGAINLKVLEKDADEAIKAGTGLVQASLEHLSTKQSGRGTSLWRSRA